VARGAVSGKADSLLYHCSEPINSCVEAFMHKGWGQGGSGVLYDFNRPRLVLRPPTFRYFNISRMDGWIHCAHHYDFVESVFGSGRPKSADVQPTTTRLYLGIDVRAHQHRTRHEPAAKRSRPTNLTRLRSCCRCFCRHRPRLLRLLRVSRVDYGRTNKLCREETIWHFESYAILNILCNLSNCNRPRGEQT